ncbi:MAG TPA: hypothetical protein VIG24_19760 [Acidimicrobiia bacterium]
MTIDESETLRRYRDALEQIVRYKRTPRAYRHTQFEKLVRLAEEALRDRDEQ